MSIGTNIYTLRKAKKITQGQLAEKLGVSEQAVSKWENEQCTPDVSLFPIIADYFGVSIDRLFGYHQNSYAEKVKQIIKAADESMDTFKEIEIISNGLEKYPNSPDLKLYLAFSLSMINRISDNEQERQEAVSRAIKLCQEVLDTCGDVKQLDLALNMLIRIYEEIGEYNKAEECLAKISADRYDFRIVGMVHLFGNKKCYAKQVQYAEVSLWKMYWTMSHVFESITQTMMQNKEYEKALFFCEAHEKLLSTFDSGCPDFYAGDKLFVCQNKAQAYMKMGNKEKCFESLVYFVELAKQVKQVAQNTDFNIAARNPIYFSNIDGEILEEYISHFPWEKAFLKYDAFFGDNAEYLQLKKEFLV